MGAEKALIAAYVLPLLGLLVALYARGLGVRLRVIDIPDGHKRHTAPTPLVGGLAVMLPFSILCFLSIWWATTVSLPISLMAAAIGMVALGYVDDRLTLSSRLRLCAKTACALACVLAVPDFIVSFFDFSFLTAGIPLYLLSIGFSVLVIVGMTSAVNMADGVDGLVIGLCLIWTVLFLFYAPGEIVPLLALLVICLFITLMFNVTGKLFLGDSGTYGLGMTLSLLSIYIYNAAESALHADVVVLWFIVPVIDCLRLMISRKLQGRSPMSPDNDHLHHRLQRIFPKWTAVLCYWSLVAVPGGIAVLEPSSTPALILAVLLVYVGLNFLFSKKVSVQTNKPALTVRLGQRPVDGPVGRPAVARLLGGIFLRPNIKS